MSETERAGIPTASRENPTLACFVRHETWDKGRVFLGPDCEDRAMALIRESWLGGDSNRTEAEFQEAWDNGEVEDWTFEEAWFY